MKDSIILIVLGISAFAFAGCRTGEPAVYWQADVPYRSSYNRILVAVILPVEDSSLMRRIEHASVELLRQKGVDATGLTGEFGWFPLAGLEQEAAFRKLCENGIDAVMTLATVPESDKDRQSRTAAYSAPASYFFQRMWNYRQLWAGNALSPDMSFQHWEAILFDLSSLQPAIVLYTPDEIASTDERAMRVSGELVRKFFKTKTLKAKSFPAGPRGF